MVVNSPRIFSRRWLLHGPVGLTAVLLAGCGNFSVPNLWPFGAPSEGRPYVVPNATKYECAGRKEFHLRMLGSGAAWVIYPDREVRLDKQAGGSRFSNGIAVLELTADEARLRDGPAIDYAGCKPAGANQSRN